MKKLIALLLALSLVLPCAAFAQDGAPLPRFNSVSVHLSSDTAVPKEQTLTFELRDIETNALLDAKTIALAPYAPTGFDMSFTVPEYEIGRSFILHLSSGEAVMTYNGTTGAYFVLQTYAMPNADGTVLASTTDFYMTLSPAKQKTVSLTLDGKPCTDLALYTYAEGILISAGAFEALGVKTNRITDGGMLLYIGGEQLLFYEGQECAYANNAAANLSLAPQTINGEFYVPVADTAGFFGCDIDYYDDGETLRLGLGRSTKGFTAEEELVNSRGLASDTEYLIWISKSEFKLRLFRGSRGNWRQTAEYPCAIGAPRTPTCEGTFKYYQRQSRWEYPGYYVGPIMRFNGGYAIHSTLLKYSGTPKDDRVGVQISHGCVRLHPQDINSLIETAPLYTTVYVTK